jgi:hypothetical protein
MLELAYVWQVPMSKVEQDCVIHKVGTPCNSLQRNGTEYGCEQLHEFCLYFNFHRRRKRSKSQMLGNFGGGLS